MMSAPAENPSATEAATEEQSTRMDVMVVDNWLIFDCPHCSQTIKLDRKDGVHNIECPSCAAAFEPLLDRDVKLPPKKTPARRRRRGPRGTGEPRQKAPKSRPTLSSLPSEGVVKLNLAPAEIEESGEDNKPPIPSKLPVRSALELERRRVEATKDNETKQQDETELNAVIEEQSGGKYKRIRVRTRKKRATEGQRAMRLYILCGLAAFTVIGLSLWGASQMYKDQLADEDSIEESTDILYVDSKPIGPEIGTKEQLLGQFHKASTVDQLLKLIRSPKRLEPVIRNYYGGDTLPALNATRFDVDSDTRDLPKDFSKYVMIAGSDRYTLYIEKTKSHGYRVDWESFIGLGEMPWKAFIDSRATKTTRMRAYLSEANYFEPPYDKDRYRVLRLEDPTREHVVYGYYSTNDTQFRRLRERVYEAIGGNQVADIEEQEFEIPVIIDIRFRSGATNNAQVDIVEYVTDTWLRP